MKNTRLVYSTDPKDQVICSGCKQFKNECQCRPVESALGAKFTIILRLEKNGRGGKTVTILDGFPLDESYLKDLSKELKAKCGVGGTFSLGEKYGIIEIQGDKRELLRKIFDSKGLRYKGM